MICPLGLWFGISKSCEIHLLAYGTANTGHLQPDKCQMYFGSNIIMEWLAKTSIVCQSVNAVYLWPYNCWRHLDQRWLWNNQQMMTICGKINSEGIFSRKYYENVRKCWSLAAFRMFNNVTNFVKFKQIRLSYALFRNETEFTIFTSE